MKSVTIINCKKSASQEKKPLKVAAYCRVSTEYEDQISSLEFQVSHFSTMIQENPDWEFAGIYAEQESGIDIENREEMNRMIKDCEQGKIDLILTKSLIVIMDNKSNKKFSLTEGRIRDLGGN